MELDLTEEVEALEPTKLNVKQKQNVQLKVKGEVGAVAHYHPKDNETEIWDEPCLFTSYLVREPGGLDINATRYIGNVVVPTCVANYLNQMDQAVEIAEAGLFRSGKIDRIINRN